jgi:hypothetical protein
MARRGLQLTRQLVTARPARTTPPETVQHDLEKVAKKKVSKDYSAILYVSPTSSPRYPRFLTYNFAGFNGSTHTGVHVFNDSEHYCSSYHPVLGADEIADTITKYVPELGQQLTTHIRRVQPTNQDKYLARRQYRFVVDVTQLVESFKLMTCIQVQQESARQASVDSIKAVLSKIDAGSIVWPPGMEKAMLQEAGLYQLFENQREGIELNYNCSVNDSRLLVRSGSEPFQRLLAGFKLYDRDEGGLIDSSIGLNPNVLMALAVSANIRLTGEPRVYDRETGLELTREQVRQGLLAFAETPLCPAVVTPLIKDSLDKY